MSIEALVRATLESEPVIWAEVVSGEIIYANAEAEKLFGYFTNALVGMVVEELMPADLRAIHAAVHRDDYAKDPIARPMDNRVGPLRALRRDGSDFRVGITLKPVQYDGKLCVALKVLDLTAVLAMVARKKV